METLQPDLLRHILLRVPVATLAAAAQHVCRLWRALVRDPSFARAHLSASRPGFLLRYRRARPPDPDARQFLVYASTSTKDGRSDVEEHGATPLDLQLVASHFVYQSCDGLLLTEHQQELLLCNPLLGEQLALPPHDSDEELCWLVGFGFDAPTGQYKVFRINYPRFSRQAFAVDALLDQRLVCDVCTVSATTGQASRWRRVGRVSRRPVFGSSGVLVGGKLHWVTAAASAEEEEIAGVLSLDVHSETFSFVASPAPLRQTLFCFELRSHLAVYGKSSSEDGTTGEIWAMELRGVAASWTKVCSGSWLLCRHIISMRAASCAEMGGLLCHLVKTDVGSRCGSPYYSYDLQTRSFKKSKLPEFDGYRVSNLFQYTPSLVSLLPKSIDREMKGQKESMHLGISHFSM